MAIAVTGVSGVADAKKPSCKNKREQAGCKLKPTAAYGKVVIKPSDRVNVLTFDGGFTVTTRGSEARNSAPKPGSVCGGARVIVKKTAVVGKRYKFSGTNDTLFAVWKMSGKVTFTSAKKAKIAGTVEARTRNPETRQVGPVICSYTLKATLKRG